MSEMKELYLIRGLPGSGKSTFAREMADAFYAWYWEADMYFYLIPDRPSGTIIFGEEYRFDASKLFHAHQWCQDRVENDMENERETIIVSNTFTTEKELKPYLKLAEKHGYQVTTMIIENRHGNKSIHGVPEETMTKMRNRFSVKL